MPSEDPTRQQLQKRGSGRRRRRGDGAIADWSTVDPALLGLLITNVTAQGAAITFGYTKDRGAYALHFADGSERFKDYIAPSEEVELVLGQIAILWRDD